MRRQIKLIAPVIVAGLIISACGGRGGSDSGSGSTSEPGVTKTSIKLGGTFAQSGTLAVAGQAGDGAAAAVAQVNAAGGVNGRKIEWVREDDKYDPTLAVTMAKKLVEQEKVFAVEGSVGTPGQLAARSYFTQAKVPALFLYSGAGQFGTDYNKFPYSMIGVPDYPSIGRAYGTYLVQSDPSAKVAVLYQNDDTGGGTLEGFKDAIKGSKITITAASSYDSTAPTVAPLVSKLKQSGATTFALFGSPQQVTQAAKQAGVLNWAPKILMTSQGFSQGLVKSLGKIGDGIVTDGFYKDPNSPQWKSDPEVATYLQYMKTASPKTDPTGRIPVVGYIDMQLMISALKTTNPPTRAGLLKAAQNMNTHVPMMLPGVTAKTGSGDSLPIQTVVFQKWNGTYLTPVGDPIDIG